MGDGDGGSDGGFRSATMIACIIPFMDHRKPSWKPLVVLLCVYKWVQLSDVFSTVEATEEATLDRTGDLRRHSPSSTVTVAAAAEALVVLAIELFAERAVAVASGDMP